MQILSQNVLWSLQNETAWSASDNRTLHIISTGHMDVLATAWRYIQTPAEKNQHSLPVVITVVIIV